MPTFTKPEQIATFEVYKSKLAPALKAVTAEGKNFLYYPKHTFTKHAGALLIVDYDANLPKDAKFQSLIGGEPLAAKGTVSLMPDNKLKFVGTNGECVKKAVCEEIQKGILILGHQVFVPADDEAPPAAPANFQQAKPGTAAAPTKRILSPGARDATAQKVVATPKATTPGTVGQKPAAPGAIGQKPAIPGAIGQKPVAPGAVGQKPAMPGAIGQKPVAPGAVGPKPVTPGAIGQKPAMPGAIGQKPAVQGPVPPKPAVAQPAAPQMPVRPQGLTPDMPTATNEGMRKGGALVTRIRELAKSPWPPKLEFYKEAHVQEIEILVKENKLTQATLTLDRLAVQILPKGQQKYTDIPEADESFLNPEERFETITKVGESCTALKDLIEHRISTLPEAQKAAAQAQWQTTIQGLNRGFFSGITANDMAQQAEADPNGRAMMIKASALLNQTVANRAAAAKKAKELWYPVMKQRLEKSKDPTAQKMIEVLGEEQFLEMAQFAEALSARNPHNVNPFADPKVNGGKILQPMELAEVAAVYGYSTQDFTALNGVLRAPEADAEKTAKYQPYIDACRSALEKLPVFKGVATRSDKTLHPSVVKTLIASGEFKPAAFVSAGTSGKVPGFGGIQSIIKNIKTGREITMFSLHTTEGEVLFPPGSVFKLTGAKLPGHPAEITDYKDLAGILTADIPAAEFTFDQVS